ncbi:MAG TPA: hypothetical protein VGF56_15090 [Rhizomicrobium sp.]|jgi:hypothetical protein
MSKIGVGVGDDFPVDDENGGAGAGQQGQASPRSEADDRADYEMWKRRRDAFRADREARQAEREEWKARKRAFKRKLKEAIHDSFGNGGGDGGGDEDPRGRDWHDRYGGRYDGRPRHFGWRWAGPFAFLAIAVPFLILMLVFSLISAAFKAPFVILALFAVAWIVFGMRHHHGRGRRYYYDSDIETPPRGSRGPRPQQPPPQGGAIVTPPPAGQ